MVVAGSLYGCIGLSAVLGYVHLGIDVIGYGSEHDAWTSLPLITVGLMFVIGIPVGLYLWWRERKPSGS
jgi:hypothetical protein